MKDEILNKYINNDRKSRTVAFRCTSHLYNRLEYVMKFLNHDLEERGYKNVNMSSVFQALLLDEVEKLEHKYRSA